MVTFAFIIFISSTQVYICHSIQNPHFGLYPLDSWRRHLVHVSIFWGLDWFTILLTYKTNYHLYSHYNGIGLQGFLIKHLVRTHKRPRKKLPYSAPCWPSFHFGRNTFIHWWFGAPARSHFALSYNTSLVSPSILPINPFGLEHPTNHTHFSSNDRSYSLIIRGLARVLQN